MKLLKTYKYKLELSPSQEKTFENWLNTCRYLYNVALTERKVAYQMSKKVISKYDQQNQLPSIRKEYTWIEEVCAQTLQDVLFRVDRSYQKFFKGSGYPKFAKKGNYSSFSFPQGFKINKDTIKLPKIGKVKYFNSREILGTPKTLTIKKQNNSWFVCVTAETTSPYKTINVDNQDAIGLDCGASRFLALSNNTFIDCLDFKKPFEKQLKILGRKLSRQVKGSNSRQKTKAAIRKIYTKIVNRRLDFLHKVSTTLSNNYSSIYMEDLNLQKMQVNSKKLVGVNNKMSDKSFGTFKLLLSYKLEERGKYLGLINPAYTSQTCSSCQSADKKSRLSQAQFVCTDCGFIDNADLNASKNILSKGIAQITKRKAIA